MLWSLIIQDYLLDVCDTKRCVNRKHNEKAIWQIPCLHQVGWLGSSLQADISRGVQLFHSGLWHKVH